MLPKKTSKEYLRDLNIFRSYCKKYIWELPEWLRSDLSLFCLKLDKEIMEEKIRIAKYKEKQERKQVSIYDLDIDLY